MIRCAVFIGVVTASGMATTDVAVQLYSDSRCFVKASTAVWDTLDSCYVNNYDLTQSASFSVDITDFTSGSEIVRISLWTDACQTPVSGVATTTSPVGVCSVALGQYYAVYTVRYRNSMSGCKGIQISGSIVGNGDCSDASSVQVQQFSNPTCTSPRDSISWKSSDGYCLREPTSSEKYTWDDSTQALTYSYWTSSTSCSSTATQTVPVELDSCVSVPSGSYMYSVFTSQLVTSHAEKIPRALFTWVVSVVILKLLL